MQWQEEEGFEYWICHKLWRFDGSACGKKTQKESDSWEVAKIATQINFVVNTFKVLDNHINLRVLHFWCDLVGLFSE